MKALKNFSLFTVLLSLLLVGCSSGAKKKSGSSSNSMVDDAADAMDHALKSIRGNDFGEPIEGPKFLSP